MMEIVNGFLLVYFVTLCVISALVPLLVKPISVCFSRPSSEDRNSWTEIMKLKAEQSKYSIKDDFAAYSKLQRKINVLESHLKENSQSRVSKSLAIKGSVHLILQAFITLLMIISMVWFRHEPIVVLKGNLFPFTSILQYPSTVPNAISTHVWVVISNVSIRSLIKPIVSKL